MILSSSDKNNVLQTMTQLLEKHRAELLHMNQLELDRFAGGDQAMYDRLKVTDAKVDGMKRSLEVVLAKEDPIGKTIYNFQHPNGLRVENKTAPFGTILIIYESRPDVTIEAAAIAFKSGNKILLKGGKESRQSNLLLVKCWHEALTKHSLSTDWITYLDLDRTGTQEFLVSPTQRVDLIVPRGGDGLIKFVKQHATCPVLVSGRGNNFLYIDKMADWEKALSIILNAKLDKISACNALDKVLVSSELPDMTSKISALVNTLQDQQVEVYSNLSLDTKSPPSTWQGDHILYEEFLDYKILIDEVNSAEEAVATINQYSGGHSVSIITEDTQTANRFMANIDAAAVYHNASTRFTDGGELGLGAELAISTDKLHHRGPLGLDQLVTNKWYGYGDGQTR